MMIYCESRSDRTFPSRLSFPGIGTRAAVEGRFFVDVAELPSSSSEGGEEGSCSLATLLIALEAVQLTELFSCANTQIENQH